MCEPRHLGGLNFKQIREFNMALLGKQAWRFIYNLESLVAKVFKARYFPNCSFFEATRGHNPSYCWRSILAAQELLKKGCAIKIGNGRTTSIWKDSWLADPADQRVVTPVIPELEDAKVISLMRMDVTAEWDMEILDELFEPRDRERILKTPISPDYEDEWYWKFSAKGNYTVKSTYRSLVEQPEVVTRTDGNFWSTLWKLRIPAKMKLHWWRISRNIIPVREVLRKRGVDLDIMCPLCDDHPETINHLFLECEKTREVWNICNLDRVRSVPGNLSLEAMLLSQDSVTLAGIASLLWVLWRARNNVVWRGARWNALSISFQVANTLEEWNARISDTTNKESTSTLHRTWNPPEIGWLKCNVDAALFKYENKVGFGAILRDDQAKFVAARVGCLNCVFDPGIAEAYACKETLKWIQAKGLSKVVIESDCAEVIKAIQRKSEVHNYFGRIIADCQGLQNALLDISFRFVGREANICVHKLARLSNSEMGCGEWHNHPPDCIKQFISH